MRVSSSLLFVAVLVVAACWAASTQAGFLTLSATDPVVDGADIALLPTDPGVVTVNDNGSTTAVWQDRPHQGQTFTTGSNPGGYVLSTVSLLHNFGSWGWTATGPWDIVVGTVDGMSNLNVIAHETIAEDLNTFDNVNFNATDGVPDWMCFTLDTPAALAPNTTYAFAVGVTTGEVGYGAVFVRSDDDADYVGGGAFSDSVAGNGFDNPMINHEFDRIFHVDMAAVPEPSTSLLALFGAISLWGWTTRRVKKA